MSKHIPVLLDEVINRLELKSGMNIVDCTLGDAGHAEKILEKISPNGRLLGIDTDTEAVLRAKQYLYNFEKQTIFVRDNFVNLKKIVVENNFNPVNGILLDLGWSSPQFEERGRGFSFLKGDERLDMRYGGEHGTCNMEHVTASDLINNLSEKELEKIFREYGEEKLSMEIAKAIVMTRLRPDGTTARQDPPTSRHGGTTARQGIETVGDLVNIILEVYRKKLKSKKEIPWVGGLHPATKVFQALRMAVNDELVVLEKVLPQAVDALASGGRLAVITFHSLEDRIVKHFFKDQENKTIKIISKKPIICSESEHRENSRARSAKLRVVEKI